MASLYCPECGTGFATSEERRAYGSTDLGFQEGMACPECFDGTLALTVEARIKLGVALGAKGSVKGRDYCPKGHKLRPVFDRCHVCYPLTARRMDPRNDLDGEQP